MPLTSRKGTNHDLKPMTIGCYTLTETGLQVAGRPSWREHEAVGEFIRRAVKASNWWLADWLAYGDSRVDWKMRLEQAIDATGYAEKTLKNARYVGLHVHPSRRRDDVEFGLHAEVAALPPEDQERWLDRAATEGWSVRELRLASETPIGSREAAYRHGSVPRAAGRRDTSRLLRHRPYRVQIDLRSKPTKSGQ